MNHSNLSGDSQPDRYSQLNTHPDPMFRSCLALAGANPWLRGDQLPPEIGKGILFSQDILSLNLWGTQLSILSACKTAWGDIRLGEGVFGLRRAFAAAGSRTLVMSLWSVNDAVTALLMDHFLHLLLTDRNLNRAQALQTAQIYIRDITIPELLQTDLGHLALQQRLHCCEGKAPAADLSQIPVEELNARAGEHPFAHPYYWGAWILQGDLTPLSPEDLLGTQL